MRVLVCGSRDFTNGEFMWELLDVLMYVEGELFLIEGGAVGADRLAKTWSFNREIPGQTFQADWTKFGKAAGPIRNKLMLDEGKPDVVLAFVNKPLSESRGTANMVTMAMDLGVPTTIYFRPET